MPKSRLSDGKVFAKDIILRYDNYYSTDSPATKDMLDYLINIEKKIGLPIRPGNYKFVNKDEILYFKACKGVTQIHLETMKPITMSTNLGNIERQINKLYNSFFRVHDSYLINIERIGMLEGTTLYFEGQSNTAIGIGPSGRSRLIKEGFLLRTGRT